MDLLLTTEGERTEVNAQNEEATDWLDAYNGPMLDVIDSGRIVIPTDHLEDTRGFVHQAAQAGLTCQQGSLPY